MDSREVALAAVVVTAAAAVALVGATLLDSPETADPAVTTGNVSDPGDTAIVAFRDANGALRGRVTAAVADTPDERYTGLGNTSALAPDEGMLFVFPREAPRIFVMRNMSVPLDIVFVGADGRVTAIHEAPVPPPGTPEGALTEYRGRAKWVVEVPRGWTDRHGVAVGDRLRINYTASLAGSRTLLDDHSLTA